MCLRVWKSKCESFQRLKRVFPPVHMCVLTLLVGEHAPSIVLWLELHRLRASQHLYNKSSAHSWRCCITQPGFTDAEHKTACGGGLGRGGGGTDLRRGQVALCYRCLVEKKTAIKHVVWDHKGWLEEEINALVVPNPLCKGKTWSVTNLQKAKLRSYRHEPKCWLTTKSLSLWWSQDHHPSWANYTSQINAAGVMMIGTILSGITCSRKQKQGVTLDIYFHRWGYVFILVHLFVVCMQGYTKTTEQISMKLGGRMWVRKERPFYVI